MEGEGEGELKVEGDESYQNPSSADWVWRKVLAILANPKVRMEEDLM